MYLISPKAAQIVADNVGIFAKTKINSIIKPDVDNYKEMLKSTEAIPEIVDMQYSNVEEVGYATLAGDAAMVTNKSDDTVNLYCLQVLPLNPDIKTSAVHFEEFKKRIISKVTTQNF